MARDAKELYLARTSVSFRSQLCILPYTAGQCSKAAQGPNQSVSESGGRLSPSHTLCWQAISKSDLEWRPCLSPFPDRFMLDAC